MNYRVELTAVQQNSPLADALDELDGDGNGAIEFEEGNEEDFAQFLEDYAGDVGEAFEQMTITKVDLDDPT
jgi:hypothetical protein